MKKLFLLFFVSAVLHVTASAQIMQPTEYAAEYTNALFGRAPTSGGLIFVKRCDSCDRISVRFNAATRYFNERAPITAAQAEALNGQNATLFFDPELRTVTRVIFRATKASTGN